MWINSNQNIGPIAVAIPARNEATHIGACLAALAQQTHVRIDHIVLCVNNTTDETIRIARAAALPAPTSLHVIDCDLPPHLAHAGQARRLAMEKAYRLVGDPGVLLTTDADGTADSNWIAANLAALRAGADAVAGWVDLDRESWHRIPLKLHEDDARECAYDALCDEIHARLDPDPADPMPRHTQQSGASIAVTGRMYRLCGGMPAKNHGEDRAFIAALRLADARIRHAPECHVTVSGRTEGRAQGGMADTIRRRLTAPDPYLDDRLEPADLCAKRARLRQTLRRAQANADRLQDFGKQTGLSPAVLGHILHTGSFGQAWAFVERESEALRRQKVPLADLPNQMRRAQAMCDALRLQDEKLSSQPPDDLAEAAD